MSELVAEWACGELIEGTGILRLVLCSGVRVVVRLVDNVDGEFFFLDDDQVQKRAARSKMQSESSRVSMQGRIRVRPQSKRVFQPWAPLLVQCNAT
jgi:hypothetical protein